MDSLRLGNKDPPEILPSPGTEPPNGGTFGTFDEKTSTRSKQAMITSSGSDESWDDLSKSEESTTAETGRTQIGPEVGSNDVD